MVKSEVITTTNDNDQNWQSDIFKPLSNPAILTTVIVIFGLIIMLAIVYVAQNNDQTSKSSAESTPDGSSSLQVEPLNVMSTTDNNGSANVQSPAVTAPSISDGQDDQATDLSGGLAPALTNNSLAPDSTTIDNN